MKILFSPSETKKSNNQNKSNKTLDQTSFVFPELFSFRVEILEKYNNFLKKASKEQLQKLFGTKKDEVINQYKKDIFANPIMKAIQRYEGVAYDYLKYESLSQNEQKYVDGNVLIFSNLFGSLRASDKIPDYKLKQGETFEDLKIEKFYCDNFSDTLDKYLKDEEILDLRAGFYEKFYTIKKPYISMKFIKDGKVVSHFAKAFRGTILKLMAKNSIQNMDELMNMEIENLVIVEIKKQKLKMEIVYNITW